MSSMRLCWGPQGETWSKRIRAAAINRLVQECAPLAWQTLLTLMARAQVSWPDPMGLSPHADAQAVQAAQQWELADLEETFLASSLERSANRVFGVVENWKAHYPSPESHPWKWMVLQAVGSGILGYLLSVADTKLRGDAPDFTAQVEDVLHEELATMQQAVQVGVHSVNDADALMVSVTQLCEEVVPTMAWRSGGAGRSQGAPAVQWVICNPRRDNQAMVRTATIGGRKLSARCDLIRGGGELQRVLQERHAGGVAALR